MLKTDKCFDCIYDYSILREYYFPGSNYYFFIYMKCGKKFLYTFLTLKTRSKGVCILYLDVRNKELMNVI